jgi:hypothetical protein
MRPATLLSLAVSVALTGCATPKPSSVWRSDQRQRLEHEHHQRSLDETLAEVIANAPPAMSARDATEDSGDSAATQDITASSIEQEPQPVAAQDSPHIDQVLPERVDRGPRKFRHDWQPFTVALDYGQGDVMVRADGTRLGDRTDATFVRARLDSGRGAALHAEWWGSDGDLFAGKLMNDGIVPKVANAELGGVDVFPHVRFDHQSGDWSVPVRIGMFADWQQLDHQEARVQREWLSFGPRMVVEPTWTMFRGQDGHLGLFTRFGADVGAAWFSEEFRNGDDRDMTTRWAGEFGAGLRGVYGRWHAELGYRLHHTMYGETQGDLFGRSDRTELQRQQVFLGVGINY